MNDRDFITHIRDECNTQLCTSAPTPPVDPPPVIPPAGPYVLRDMLNPSVSHRDDFVAGTVYAFPIKAASGMFSMSSTSGTDGNNGLQMSVTQAPGDMSGKHPNGGTYGVESAGLQWGPTQGPYNNIAIVPAPGWYINVLMTGNTCPLVWTWH